MIDAAQDTVVFLCAMDAVKFSDEATGLIEGLAIPFGGPASGKDLDGEKFTKDTDLALDWYPNGRPLLYDHGTDAEVGVQVVGRQVSAKVVEAGMWAEAQLNRAHQYFEAIQGMVKDGKLYFSSGSVPHLVQASGDGTIKRWPWVEQSLTTTPANPYATVSVKRASAAAKSLGLAIPEGLGEPDYESKTEAELALKKATAEAIIILAEGD